MKQSRAGEQPLGDLIDLDLPAEQLERLARVHALLRVAARDGDDAVALDESESAARRRRLHRESSVTLSTLLIVSAAALFLGLRSSTPRLTPENIGRPAGTVGLVGYVLRPPREIRRTLSFILTDRNRAGRVHVLYPGTSPIPLRAGEEVNVTGIYRNDLFLAYVDSLTVNCGTQQHC